MEIKAFNYDWGGVCDDGVDLEEGNVICREAGYSLGAHELFIGSQFGKGLGHILLDELDCKGDESSILECKFDPWNVTDCNDNEWVGVSCHVGSGVNEECDPIGVRDLLLYHQKNVTRLLFKIDNLPNATFFYLHLIHPGLEMQ